MKTVNYSGNFLCYLLIFFLSLETFGQQAKINEFEKELAQAKSQDDYGKAAFYSYEIGKIYSSEGASDKASKYFTQSANFGDKGEDLVISYLSYQRLGELFGNENNSSKSLSYYQKALKIAKEIDQVEYVVDALLNVANAYANHNRHKRSIAPLEEALAISLEEGYENIEFTCYQLLKEYHQKLGNKNKSIEYAALVEKINQDRLEQQANQDQLDSLSEKVEKADAAATASQSKFYEQSRKLRDAEDNLLAVKYSLDQTATKLKYKEDSLVYARQVSDNQKLQIDLLNKDKAIAAMQISEQKAQIRHANLVRNFIIIAALLCGALVLVLIRSYRKKIEANKEIDRQNEKINGSINYAKRIQEAMLHNAELRQQLIPESFILFKPRDSVSGDFYFLSEIKSWYDPDVVIAAVDCTGHGIPGAFMSMIGMNSLNQIIGQGEAETDQILQNLDKTIKTSLQQETTGNKDGMDVALCIYRKEKGVIEFSGAKNPLVYVQNNELFQIKGDIHPIGGIRKGKKKGKIKKVFKKHTVVIDQPTMIYLFSDGYQDQFGGEEGAKFMSKKFKQLLLEISNEPVEEQKAILENRLHEWMGQLKQTDDILVMGIKLMPIHDN